MKRYRRIVLLLLLGVGYYLWGRSASTTQVLPTEQDLVTVKTGALQEEIQVLGVIQLVNSQILSFETNGKVVSVLVEPGQEVKKGDILAELDTRDIDLDIAQQELALESARISYNKLFSTTKDYQIKQTEATAQQHYNEFSLGDQDISSLQHAEAQKMNDQQQQIETLSYSIALNQQKLADLDNEIAYTNQQGSDTLQKSTSEYTYQIEAAQNTAKSTVNDVKNLLAKIETYFYIDTPNDRPGALSAENTKYLRSVIALYPRVRSALETFELALNQGTYTDTATTLILIHNTQEMITTAIELTDAAYDAIGASVTSQSLSQTTLDTYSSTLNNFKDTLLSTSSSLDQTIKSLTSTTDPELTELGTLNNRDQQEQTRLQLQHAIQLDTLALESAQENEAHIAADYDLQIARKQNDIAQSKSSAEIYTLNARSLKAGPTSDEKSSASNQIAQAEISLEKIKHKKEAYQIIAQFDGIVAAVDFDTNDVALANEGGITLEIPNLFEVEVKFDQLDIVKIHTGLPATISFDAYPGRIFTGHIDKIDPNPVDEQGVILYKAYIKLLATDIKIFNKMDTTVVVSLGETAGVLIPAIAITSTEGKDFVQKQVGANFINQEIDITLTNGTDALVGSGLQVGDRITKRTFVLTNKATAGGLFGGGPRGGAGGPGRSQQAGAR